MTIHVSWHIRTQEKSIISRSDQVLHCTSFSDNTWKHTFLSISLARKMSRAWCTEFCCEIKDTVSVWWERRISLQDNHTSRRQRDCKCAFDIKVRILTLVIKYAMNISVKAISNHQTININKCKDLIYTIPILFKMEHNNADVCWCCNSAADTFEQL